jgi:Zn-dependent protease
MGHALAMRYYGISSSIVLYHFGGLAIPDQYSTMSHGSRRSRQDPISEIVISAAGPGAQIGLAIVLIILIRLSGYAPALDLGRMQFGLPYLEFIPWLSAGRAMTAGTTQLFLFFLVLTSVFWALLNLLPVYPLDGGQIARNTFTIFNPREGIRYSLMLSIITAASVAFYGFTSNNFFLGIMFAMLAYSSFQVLQAYSGRGGY